jgi:hypothetical protein
MAKQKPVRQPVQSPAQPPTEDVAAKLKAEDLRKRAEAFNKEMIPLLAKYEIGLSAIPLIGPQGQLLARPQIFDARDMDKPKATPAAEPTPAKSELAEG